MRFRSLGAQFGRQVDEVLGGIVECAIDDQGRALGAYPADVFFGVNLDVGRASVPHNADVIEIVGVDLGDGGVLGIGSVGAVVGPIGSGDIDGMGKQDERDGDAAGVTQEGTSPGVGGPCPSRDKGDVSHCQGVDGSECRQVSQRSIAFVRFLPVPQMQTASEETKCCETDRNFASPICRLPMDDSLAPPGAAAGWQAPWFGRHLPLTGGHGRPRKC